MRRTPYKIDNYPDGLCVISGVNGQHVTDFVPREDAEFIVLACNSFDVMCEALRKCNTCASLPDAVKELVRDALAKAGAR